MEAFVRNVLLVFATLFPIVNPVGMAPIFAGMTLPYSSAIRRTMALRIAVNGIVLLVASLFIGSYILEFFGISIAAVQLGGGLVVTVSGWHILNSHAGVSDRQSDAPRDSSEILSKAFYPLTLPLTVGPGSIAVAITLGSNAHSETHLQLILTSLASVVGSILIGLSIYLSYRYADKLEELPGSHWHERAHTALGVHRALHRHPDYVQRSGVVLQRSAAPRSGSELPDISG